MDSTPTGEERWRIKEEIGKVARLHRAGLIGRKFRRRGRALRGGGGLIMGERVTKICHLCHQPFLFSDMCVPRIKVFAPLASPWPKEVLLSST